MGDVTVPENIEPSRHPWVKYAMRKKDRRATKRGAQRMRTAMAFS